LFKGAWPGTHLSEMGRVLVRFHAHGGDPAAAWPTPEQRLIPGPAPFYATLAALLLPLATAALIVLRRRLRHQATSGGVGARWARTRDLRTLRVGTPQPGRLTLGRIDGHLVAAEPRQSVVVIGPTQTGKTTGFAIP